MKRQILSIDLKSFYASVECVERDLDPLTTNLVVADEARTEKTICLAVSPALKSYGIPGRARLFEVIQKCQEIKNNQGTEISYIIAPPRMQLYIDYSSKIYEIYLKYASAEDIHVYSIDEVFIDCTNYLNLYSISAKDLVKQIIQDILETTGITAAAGIGTNLYLAKVAMDIVAKHVTPDEDGVCIAALNEMTYRQLLWNHRPLKDFWRIGRGISKKLEANGMYTMGDIARMSLTPSGEDFLFRLFGVDAELLIDHAWGIEPCTMKDIKNYKPSTNSISSGQVLSCGYDTAKARKVVREMIELQALQLVSKKLVTDSITLDVGYDRDTKDMKYDGPMSLDPYGRTLPKPAHGSVKLPTHTSSTEKLVQEALILYDRIIYPQLKIKRFNISLGNVMPEKAILTEEFVQLNLFSIPTTEEETKIEERERKLQDTMLSIQKRYGKNAILKGTNLEEGATTIERNQQIGGHKA